MMIITESFQIDVLIVCGAIILLAVAASVLRFERMIRRYRDFWDSPTGDSVMSANPTAVNTLVDALDQRMQALVTQVAEINEQRLHPAGGQPAEAQYSHAVRMAKQGAAPEDLIRVCGLARSEAQLLYRLHTARENSQVESIH